jgi:chorismate lyase/3-hydroxybenzoate synthase
MSPTRSCALPHHVSLDPPAVPAWVEPWLADAVAEIPCEDGALRVRDGGPLLWLELTVPGACELDDARFRLAVAGAYDGIGQALRERGQHPLRWWNYIPDIRRPGSDGFTRYELFNIGRLDSFRAWPDAPARGGAPAATAVGHRGKDFVVQVLAATQRGVSVENPRQSPAHLYSSRYGPVPPAFARATLAPELGAARLAVVSGTASIVGEDSQHVGALLSQLGETLRNLASIARAVEERAGMAPAADPLARYREVRAYVVRPSDLLSVVGGVREAFPRLQRFEIAEADLCRPELLVELEGLLELG